MKGARFRLFLAALLGLCALTPTQSPANGVNDNRILFGQSAALEGPAAALGSAMNLGIEVAFAEANRAGGVQGRRLELITLDDGMIRSADVEELRQLLANPNRIPGNIMAPR